MSNTDYLDVDSLMYAGTIELRESTPEVIALWAESCVKDVRDHTSFHKWTVAMLGRDFYWGYEPVPEEVRHQAIRDALSGTGHPEATIL